MTPRSSIRPNPRLYVFAPAVDDPVTLSRALAEMFRAADVAAVLIRLGDADERGVINRVRAAAPGVPSAGAAALAEGRSGIVARSGAEGAQVGGPDAVRAALQTPKPNFVVGAGGLHSRHDAMVAAEAGADYVMFGEPDAAGRHPSRDAVIDRVAWWAAGFGILSVGDAIALVDAGALAPARRGFVSL